MVNLKKDIDRRNITTQRLSEVGICLQVLPGFDCLDKNFDFSMYRSFASAFWGDKNQFKPGAFGCYLSHARYWKFMLSTGAEFAFIIEDDVVPDKDASFCLDISDFPSKFDFITFNEAPYRWLKKLEELKRGALKSEDKKYVSLSNVLINLISHGYFEKKIPALGAYGYLVSRKGAQKMLSILEQQKICMGVDYAMLFNSLSETDIEQLKKVKNISQLDKLFFFLNHVSHPGVYLKLNSYIYSPTYLVSIDSGFPTSLDHNYFISNSVFSCS